MEYKDLFCKILFRVTKLYSYFGLWNKYLCGKNTGVELCGLCDLCVFSGMVVVCKQKRNLCALCGKKGFTLIEIIVSLLIFGILSALLFSTFMQIQRNIHEQRWKNELTEEGIKICNIIRTDLTGASKIYYADQDSISFINQDGKLSSFYRKDSLLFGSNKSMVSADTKVISFGFIYYLPSGFIGESSEPIYFLPVDQINLERIKVIDWEIRLKKGKSTLHLKTGVFIRSIRQQ